MTTEPAALLGDLHALRQRTRRDAHGYWLPLILFGVLVLAAPLLYWAASAPLPADGVYRLSPTEVHIGGFFLDPLQLFSGHPFESDPLAVGLYWFGVVVVGTLVTLGWYRWRAQRVGVHLRTRVYLLYALAALLVCVVLMPLVARWTLAEPFGGFTAPGVWASVAAFVVGVVIAVLSARAGRAPAARAGLVVGVVLTMVAFGNLAILTSTHGYGFLSVIAAGLFGLAWAERSGLCATIATAFTGAALLANLYDMENVLPYTTDQVLVTFDNLLLPGLVLIIGGIIGLVADRRPAPQETPQ
jgi:hypothetical protein